MANSEKQWFAVYTRPRSEKKTNELLQKKNIESWCPVRKVVRQWSDRKKTIEEPLFTSYVFVHITAAEKAAVLQTNGVINFVHHINKPAVIQDKEIEAIKSYLNESDAVLSTQSWESLEENIKVKIKHGVFMDNTGTLVKNAKKKLYVRLESLGQVMIVEFPAGHVAPIY